MQSTTETAHAVLRRETERWHVAVEQAFSGYDLRSRAGFSAFLTAQAVAVGAIETELDRRDVSRFVPDWPLRRRSAALRDDLYRLGHAMPLPLSSPLLDTVGRQFGALYVLEGSRLGGVLLAREASQSDDPAVRATTAFFTHKPGPQGWATFRGLLNAAATDTGDLVDGAQQSFGCFLAAADHYQSLATLSVQR